MLDIEWCFLWVSFISLLVYVLVHLFGLDDKWVFMDCSTNTYYDGYKEFYKATLLLKV